MKRIIVAGLIVASLLGVAHAAEEKFTSIVSPQDFAAAGLAGLTPEQLARLNTLVENYKSGALAAARRAADDALAAKQAAEARAVASEAKAEAARADATKAQAATAEATKSASTPGILAKAKVMLMPGTQVEIASIDSTIAGKFHGWEPGQIFTLANGQRWQVANKDHYYSPVVENPKVQVTPAALGGYWLLFPDLDIQVRVKPVQ
jgi:hypothetical protein